MAWEFGSSAVSSTTAPCLHPPSEASPLAHLQPHLLRASQPHGHTLRDTSAVNSHGCVSGQISSLAFRPGKAQVLGATYSLAGISSPSPAPCPHPLPTLTPRPSSKQHRLWLLTVTSVPLPAPLIWMVTPTSRPPVSGLLQQPPPALTSTERPTKHPPSASPSLSLEGAPALVCKCVHGSPSLRCMASLKSPPLLRRYTHLSPSVGGLPLPPLPSRAWH